MAESRHICGPCQEGFGSEEQYLDHQCPETGFTPRDPQNLGERFASISGAALERGAERADSDVAEDVEATDSVPEAPVKARRKRV